MSQFVKIKGMRFRKTEITGYCPMGEKVIDVTFVDRTNRRSSCEFTFESKQAKDEALNYLDSALEVAT